MTKTKEIVILIVVVVIIGAIWWSGQKPKPEPESPPEYEKVSFCGKEYLTQKIEIEGVDVVKRIGELVKWRQDTCGNVLRNNEGQFLPVSIKLLTNPPQKDIVYVVDIGYEPFFVKPSNMTVAKIGAHEDEVIGSLR